MVSGFRDPIARAVAEFFQVCGWAYPWVLEGESVSLEKAHSFLFSEISNQGSLLTKAWSWFETELGLVFGVDPLTHPFDRSRGWEILDTGNVRLLLYRMEALDSVFREGLLEFAGLDRPLTPRRANSGTKKKSGSAYQAVLFRLRFPRELCEKVYSHPLVRHFYPETMTSDLCERW
ncbi:MAG: putative capsular polysaccharide synthesis family protein [Longimicrobiales bacterium]